MADGFQHLVRFASWGTAASSARPGMKTGGLIIARVLFFVACSMQLHFQIMDMLKAKCHKSCTIWGTCIYNLVSEQFSVYILTRMKHIANPHTQCLSLYLRMMWSMREMREFPLLIVRHQPYHLHAYLGQIRNLYTKCCELWMQRGKTR